MHRNPELLARYRAGETSAYEEVYLEHEGPVRRFLSGGFTFVSRGRTCRYRGNVPGIDAEAIVQETFVRAFLPSTRKNYDGERPFRNYLFSIAKNLVLREFQRRDRVVSADQTEEATDVIAFRSSAFAAAQREVDPEHSVADAQLHALTSDFIQTLGGEEQEFFSHRFAHGLTQEATAKEMGVTRARVKLLEKNLRRRFLAALRDHGYFVGYNPKPRWTRASEAA